MKWFEVQAAADGRHADVWINDQIGIDWWSGDGTTASAFINAIASLGDVEALTVHINSPGALRAQLRGGRASDGGVSSVRVSISRRIVSIRAFTPVSRAARPPGGRASSIDWARAFTLPRAS